jgi:hypothetical protein
MSELFSILSDEEKNIIIKEIEENGHHTIKTIKDLLIINQKEHDYRLLDADLIALIDIKLEAPIFITENEIYFKEELIEKYKLNKFKVLAESLFEQQKIELIGDDIVIHLEDDNKNNNKIYNTNIYIGKEKWDEFLIMFKFMKSLSFVSETNKNLLEQKNVINNLLDVFSKEKNI